MNTKKHYKNIQDALDSGDYDCFGVLACSVLNTHIKDGSVVLDDNVPDTTKN